MNLSTFFLRAFFAAAGNVRAIADRITAGCGCAALATGLVLTIVGPLRGQLPEPRLHWIYPPGGQLGTSVDVTIQGVDLDTDADGALELVFSHPGITAEQKMSPQSPENEPQPLPDQFVVHIADDVPTGIYEVRIRGRYGISRPRPFAVGQLPEVLEQGGNNTLETPMSLEVNSVVSGRAGGDSYDVYQFPASAGQRVLIGCDAWGLDSRMDATLTLCDAAGNQLAYSRDVRRNEPLIDFTAPADGNYLLQVYDFTYRGGDSYFYRLSVSTQPHLDFVFPPAGVPGTTGTFTLYGRNLPGATAADGVAIDGAALQQMQVEINIPAEPPGPVAPRGKRFPTPAESGMRGFAYRLQTPAGPSNPVFISLATGEVVSEQEPNDRRDQSQQIVVPCEVVGRFGQRDSDWFSFKAKQGQRFAVEVYSQRRGLPTDPMLLVQHVGANEQGEPTVRDVAESDDVDPKFANPPFDTPLRDASLVFTADVDGLYRVLVKDLFAGSDPDPRHVYSLSIAPPRPDFHLLATLRDFANPDPLKVVATAPILRPGGTELIIVQAYRRGGFSGPITVTCSGLPDGVDCPPVVIPSDQNRATLMLAAAGDAAPHSGTIEIVGHAMIDNQQVRREACGSVVVWDKSNANETTYARLTGQIPLSIIDEPMPLSIALDKADWQTTPGSKLSIPVQITRREGVKGALKLEAQGLPAEIKAAALSIDEQTDHGALEITVDPKAPIGAFPFYLAGQSKVTYQRKSRAAGEDAAAAKDIDIVVHSLPLTLDVAAAQTTQD